MYNNLQNSYTLSANHHVYSEVKSLMSVKFYKWMSVKVAVQHDKHVGHEH